MPRKTVLHDEHVALGGRIVDFHGWLLPVQYQGILAEHKHCRSAAALFDTSHMGQILITTNDPDAIGLVATQDAAAMKVGRCKYGFLLNDAGGIIDDTVLMRLSEKQFMLVVNAGTADEDFRLVSERLADSAEVVNRCRAGWAKIDLQGPLSAQILAPLTDADLSRLGYFSVVRTNLCRADCILSRTGYTGELGYEIFAPGDSIVEIFARLTADDRVVPAGLGARDSLRLEMCYPLHGQDIDANTNPVEADLAFFLKSGRPYAGSQAVKRITAAGVDRKLVAFVSRTRRRCRSGDTIRLDGQPVGTVTSGAFSPSLDVSIGMGYVRANLADLAGPGRELQVAADRAAVAVTLAEKPIYKQGTCRTKEPLSPAHQQPAHQQPT